MVQLGKVLATQHKVLSSVLKTSVKQKDKQKWVW